MTTRPMTLDQALVACGRLADVARTLHQEYLSFASAMTPLLPDPVIPEALEHVRRVTADFGAGLAEATCGPTIERSQGFTERHGNATRRQPKPWIFKDHPACGDWVCEPWQWTIAECRCDLDGGDLQNRTWSIVYKNALMHAAHCPDLHAAAVDGPPHREDQP